MSAPNKKVMTKLFICPYCGCGVEVSSNQDIIEHITLSAECTCTIDFSEYSDIDILKRLIRNGLLTKDECFVSQK